MVNACNALGNLGNVTPRAADLERTASGANSGRHNGKFSEKAVDAAIQISTTWSLKNGFFISIEM